MWTDAERSRWERHLRAMVKDAGSNDPEAFAQLVELADWLNREGLPDAYAQLQAQGYSARDIARPLPCTHQAAHARYARR